MLQSMTTHPAPLIQYGRRLQKGTLGAIFTGNTFTAVSRICKGLPFYRAYGKNINLTVFCKS